MHPFLSTTIVASLMVGLVVNPHVSFARGTAETPIKHIVVIFGENISFDHYFGTYPKAINPPGEPVFHAAANTPTVNGLNEPLMSRNPNLNTDNGAGASN